MFQNKNRKSQKETKWTPPNTPILDRSLSWLATCTSIKSGEVNEYKQNKQFLEGQSGDEQVS